MELLDEVEPGTESTISCPLSKALESKGLRLSNETVEKSAGPSVSRAACSADMSLACAPGGCNAVLY